MAGHSKRKTARRPKGQGTEWQDKKSKHWRWRIRSGGKNYFVSDLDRNRAAEEFDRLKASLKKRTKVDDAKQLLSAFISYALEDSIRRDVSASTFRDYTKRCRLFILGPLGHYRLCDLDAKIIRRWLNATRDNYAFESAKQARALLERMLDVAVEDKILEENPAALVKPPKPIRKPDTREDEDGGRAMSDAQLALFLAEALRTDRFETDARGLKGNASRAVRGDSTYTLYTLKARLGFRRGEILGLRWKDIDFEKKIIRVRQQVTRDDESYRISATLKTPAARRDLPMEDDIAQMLRTLKLRLGARAHVKGLVFPDKDGNERDPMTITRQFARICARIGLTGFHLHDLRHTAITRWRKAGVDLEVAAKLAGHEKADVTANVYSESDMERKRAAIGKR